MQIKDGKEYHSLYEYLGYPARKKLGKEVNKVSQKTKQKIVTQYVENEKYKGKVFCYTIEFLDEYFKKQVDKAFTQDEYDDLPF